MTAAAQIPADPTAAEVSKAMRRMPHNRIAAVGYRPASSGTGASTGCAFSAMMASRRDDFRNRLIWGDNKLVMASLLKEFKGKIDSIYFDPPLMWGRISR
jgi:hypothetical protein